MTFISNDCLAYFMYKRLGQEYESPFIGTLFENDEQYLKFCQNFDYYIKLEPVFGEPKLPVTKMDNPDVPVMFLGDIEIHWPHKHDLNDLITKYNKRVAKVTEPLFIWSDMQIFNKDISIKERFKQLPNHLYVDKDDIEIHKNKSLTDWSKEGTFNTVSWLDYDVMAEHVLKKLNLC